MESLKLDKKAVKSFRAGKGILFAIALIISLTLAVLGKTVCEGGLCIGMYIAALCIFILFLLVFIIYPPLEYRQWGYYIGEDRVEIEHGIIFINKTVIPIIRIQNITISQGPVNIKFGLFDVQIYTASDNFKIPCLDKDTADKIASGLKEGIYRRLEARS